MRSKYLVLAVLPLIIISLIVVNISKPHTAHATFDANNLMDDYVLEDVGTMTANQIDQFLNSFSGSCISTNSGFSAPLPTGYSPSTGFTYGGNVSAGNVIYAAAQAYGMNPEVILTTLQKEQSLVVGDSGCDVLRYAAATGYGCPDGGTTYNYSGVDLYTINGVTVTSVSGTCVNTSLKVGFSQQVIRTAWLLRFGEQRSEGNVNWAIINGSWDNSDDPTTCYYGPMTQGNRQQCQNGPMVYYDGYTTIDNQSVHMDTGATAALYWYTPHLAGNQNFEDIFQSWFGPTTGSGFQLAISDNTSDTRQWVVYDNIKQYVPDSQTINAWGLENVPLTTMPAAQLADIPTGPNLGRLMVLNTGSPTIYFVDNGLRYKIPWMSMFNAWNFSGQVISGVSPGLFSLPADGGNLSFDIKDPSSSTTYMLDGGNSSGQTVLRPFQDSSVMAAWEGSSTNYTAISSDYFNTINQAIGATITSTKLRYGTSYYEVDSGVKIPVNPPIINLYPGTEQYVSSATFARLPVSGQWGTQLIQSTSSPAVYLLDGGQLHQVLWPNALTAWQAPGATVTMVSPAFLSTIPTSTTSIGAYTADVSGQLYLLNNGYKMPVSSALDSAYRNSQTPYSASSTLMSLYPTSATTLTGFVKSASQPAVYLVNNSGQLCHLQWPDRVSAWGGYTAGITVLPDYEVSSIPTSTTNPIAYVTDGTTNYLLDNGNRWTVSASIATDWNLNSPQSYTDGTLSRFPVVGALGDTVQDGQGDYYLIHAGMAYGTADSNIAQVWAINNAPTMSPRAVPANLPVSMLTRFVNSSVSGDSRTFVIDNGDWYTVSAAQLANLGGTNAPIMSLDPALAPNSITSWTSVVVKSNAGTYYVIDGGGKRYFEHQVILDQWTNNETLTVPTVTDGFLNLLPTKGWIERAIKGSGPAIYSAEDGTKRHILYWSTYITYYAPYMNVTDDLLNAMPTGTDISS